MTEFQTQLKSFCYQIPVEKGYCIVSPLKIFTEGTTKLTIDPAITLDKRWATWLMRNCRPETVFSRKSIDRVNYILINFIYVVVSPYSYSDEKYERKVLVLLRLNLASKYQTIMKKKETCTEASQNSKPLKGAHPTLPCQQRIKWHIFLVPYLLE